MAKPPSTTYEFKLRHKETLGAKDGVMSELEKIEQANRDKQNAADAAAKKAREDAFHAESAKLWGSKEDERGTNAPTVYGKAEKMSKEAGGQGFQNYVSAISEIIEFSILLCAALAKDIRSGTRLVNLAGSIGGVALDLTSQVVSGVLHPIATAEETSEAMSKFCRKWGVGKGGTLALPDSIIQAATCNSDGKIAFKSLKDEFLAGTSPALVEPVEALHQSMVRAFLVYKGYTEATPGSNEFRVSDPSAKKLDQNVFYRLQNDPHDGLKAFVSKMQAINLTDEPVTYAGGKPVTPEPVKNEPEPRSMFKFR